jgi:hypothetical protein
LAECGLCGLGQGDGTRAGAGNANAPPAAAGVDPATLAAAVDSNLAVIRFVP